MSTKIKHVHARQVMDCKFRPVIEVDVELENGIVGRGAAPTGSSVGSYEAVVLRDNDPSKFCGLSVFRAIDNVNNILSPALIGMDVMDQKAIDNKMIAMDGTPRKEKFGGNTIYSISIACAAAAAETQGTDIYHSIARRPLKTLPLPTANSIIGGRYPDKTVCYQEFTFCPYKAKDMTEAMEIIYHVHRAIGDVFSKAWGGIPTPIGNSHGWQPPTEDPAAIMQRLDEAVRSCGYQDKVAYALDCAASEMYDETTKTYYLNGTTVDRDGQIAYVKKLTEQYPFLFVEDVLDENDWEGYQIATKELTRTLLIGDDLTVTNPALLKRAHEESAVQGFIFKPNQIGTITEAVEAHRYAKEHNMLTIPSQRGGGTIWDVVIDLGVGLETEACKSCAPRGGESVYAMNCLYRAAQENPDAALFDFSPLVKF